MSEVSDAQIKSIHERLDKLVSNYRKLDESPAFIVFVKRV